MPTAQQSCTQGDTATPCPQLICLDAMLQSEQALFRVIALLHRKHVSVRALIVLPREYPSDGHVLRLAVLAGNAPAGHIIELIRGIVGVTSVRIANSPTVSVSAHLRLPAPADAPVPPLPTPAHPAR